jgi:hypothetical protein
MKSCDRYSPSDAISARSMAGFTSPLDSSPHGAEHVACHYRLSPKPVCPVVLRDRTSSLCGVWMHILSLALPFRVIDWGTCIMRPQNLEWLLQNYPRLRVLQWVDIPLCHYGRNLTCLYFQCYVSSLADQTRDISLIDWKELPVDHVNSPAVKLLGLRYARESLGFHQCRLLFGFLRLLGKTSTTLRTVQFLVNHTRLKARQ